MFDRRCHPVRVLSSWALLVTACCGQVDLHAQPARIVARLERPTHTSHIADSEIAGAVLRAANGAQRRLASPACAGVLGDFRDSSGRTLQDVLDRIELPVTEAMTRIIFRDGRDHATCQQTRVMAFTGPGSRVVFVCGRRFTKLSGGASERLLIHELLHTLGLAEWPPAPGEIDLAVSRRCF